MEVGGRDAALEFEILDVLESYPYRDRDGMAGDDDDFFLLLYSSPSF